LEVTSIFQGSDEPYQEFVAHLLQNIETGYWWMPKPETYWLKKTQLASENANKACKTAFQPYRKRATLRK
jgi:hypothetical protein